MPGKERNPFGPRHKPTEPPDQFPKTANKTLRRVFQRPPGINEVYVAEQSRNATEAKW
ncbi:MAG: hypothetical protein CM1200mP2_25310 [Planctomycetaceae bacterium]|nr:MAG: hypothetical protein CM1200mP2_25310 [Planctomycetaceae bacterium]